MNESKLSQLAASVELIAAKAGDAILEVYRQDIEVITKADESPLTQADLASHRVITAALAELTPEIPVLSEESAEIDFAERSTWQEYWLIDPLDGTKEFINRNGEFTVNIALIRRNEPVMGVVYVPVTGVTYSGVVGEGASRREADGEAVPIGIRRPCADPRVVVGSRSDANPARARMLEARGPQDLVSMGRSLKCCFLAEGRADFYPRLGPTSEWDTGAAHAVVLAAGGRIVKLDGESLKYNTKESLLNPEFLVIADDSRDWLAPFKAS